ncbi:hypothetical protein IFM89_033086 [Coptis chinensis]|uniref:KIB1-4 beta-propeller domain-containing protein n=1 Tax=Coptis chinensis TaxID=261450 RepID=A0A835IG14_9MAGN|nr:hypothetical protein IFM89_033086 [Coptis chinensis]
MKRGFLLTSPKPKPKPKPQHKQVLHPFSKKVTSLAPVIQLPGVVGCHYNDRQKLVFDVIKNEAVCTITSSCMREFYIYKAVMLPGDGIVMVIHGLDRKLAFCKVSDENKKWISIEGDGEGKFNDVTIFKREFYAVKDNGNVYVVRGFDSSSTLFVKLAIHEPDKLGYYKKYLVEVKGELFLLNRVRYPLEPGDEEADLTLVYVIKKIELNGPKWVSVDNFDNDCAMFVGCNDSFTRLTSDVPDCKGNSIYFTDDFVDGVADMDNNLENFVKEPIGCQDIGVWDMTSDVFDRLIYPSASKSMNPPPVWFTAN